MIFEVQQLVGHLDDQEVAAKWQREIDEISEWHTIQGGPFGMIKGEVKECYLKPFNNPTGCGLWVRKFDGNLLLYLYHWWLKLKMGWDRGFTVSPFNFDKYAP